MAWQLLIGGVDYSGFADFASWHIYQSARHRGSTCSGRIYLPEQALPRPKGLQQVILRRHPSEGGERLFGGVIQKVTQIPESPEVFCYQISCSDYTRWLDHLPTGGNPYTGQASDIVRQIVADWVTRSSGTDTALGDPPPAVPLTLNHVQDMQVDIGLFQASYVPVSQALDQLAKMIYAVWFVDPTADLWFCLPDYPYLQAPLPLQSVGYFDQALDYDSPRGLRYETLPVLDADNDTQSYRNLQISEDVSTLITGVTARNYYEVSAQPAVEDVSKNFALIGDGYTKFFPLYNMPVDPAHTKVEVGSKVYSPAAGNLKVEYEDGSPANPSEDDWCFVCSTNKGIRFNKAPDPGANIKVTYNYYFEGASIIKNRTLAAEVAAREGFGPGMYYQVISDPSLTSPITVAEGITAWQAMLQITLNRYSRIKLFATFESLLSGWRPGQVFGLVSLKRGDVADSTYNVWGKTFSMKFFVTQVEQRIVNDTTVESRIEAASDIWGY